MEWWPHAGYGRNQARRGARHGELVTRCSKRSQWKRAVMKIVLIAAAWLLVSSSGADGTPFVDAPNQVISGAATAEWCGSSPSIAVRAR